MAGGGSLVSHSQLETTKIAVQISKASVGAGAGGSSHAPHSSAVAAGAERPAHRDARGSPSIIPERRRSRARRLCGWHRVSSKRRRDRRPCSLGSSPAPHRRAVVADGRRHAAGRTGDRHARPDRHHAPSGPDGSRRRWCTACRAPACPGRGRPVLPAGPDLRRCLRRRDDRHQRGGGRHLQVREHTPVGRGADPRPVGWLARRGPPRRGHGVARRLVRTPISVRQPRPGAGAHLRHARCRQTVGRLLRPPGHGSHRSLHRIGRHARDRDRRDAARDSLSTAMRRATARR